MIDGGTLKYLLEVGGASVESWGMVPVEETTKYDLHASVVTAKEHHRMVVRNHGTTGEDGDYTVQENETSMNEMDVIGLVRFLYGE